MKELNGIYETFNQEESIIVHNNPVTPSFFLQCPMPAHSSSDHLYEVPKHDQ